jgi:hypothetical protein
VAIHQSAASKTVRAPQPQRAIAAKPRILPPARAFAKAALTVGPKVVKVGGKQAPAARERFALPQGFRRSAANRLPEVPSPVSPRKSPVQSNALISGAGFLGALENLPQREAARQRQALPIDLHPWSLPETGTGAALGREATQDFTGSRRRPAAVIQFTQLPLNQLIVPPALPLQSPVGRPATSYFLQRISSTAMTTTGAPLPLAIRNPLARTFSIDLTPIRVHTDLHAQKIARTLSTRAFAYGKDIFLGAGEQPTDLRLMAHEVAHVVQQSHGATLQHFTPGPGDACEREAEQASAAAVRGESFTVQQQTSARPQGYGLGDLASDLGIEIPDPLDWLANKANIIPGFRMFTIVLGVNPINMSAVDRSAANILRALIEVMPGGGLITQALDNSGVFEKAGAFVEAQIESLGMTGAAIKAAVTEFIAGLSLKRIVTEPGTVWAEAERIFTEPIDRIISFAKGLVNGIIELIKDAILKPIAKLAEGTEGYNLLKGILGKDPITGEAVTPSAETLLGPLLNMIGLGDVWQKMQQAKAIPRAWAWFQTTMSQLFGFVSQIPDLFISAFKSLTIEDIILVPKAFAKLAGVFGGFLGKFVSWGVAAMFKLLEIVFDVVNPKAFGYVKQTASALKSILQNPLPFVGNLVLAAKTGFVKFGSNFLNHLKKGLIDWLTGSLEGVYIPKALSLPEFGKLALSILGITWAQIRGKIVKALGPAGATIMAGLEAAFDVVMALKDGGPAAAWEVIKDKLTGLKDTIVSGIISFVVEAVVTKAIPKLIAMFIPGAGFISAIISIWDIIKTFIAKLEKIGQVIGAFVNSIVAIAAGNIGAAAAKVESVLGGLLSLAISFFAGFVGLGKVSNKVREVITKVRATVDKGIDTAINFIITKAKKLFAYLFGKTKDGKKPKKPSEVEDQAGKLVVGRLSGSHSDEEIQTVINQVKQELAPAGLKRLEFGALNSEGEAPLIAEASPAKTVAKKKKPKAKTASVVMVARILFKTAAVPAIEGTRRLLGGHQAPPLSFGAYTIPQTRGPAVPGAVSGAQQATPVGTPPTGQHKQTTMLLQPAPGATEVKVMSWNTGEPVPGSASSHAERAFTGWFTTAIRRNVNEVHININLSPCSICSSNLPNIKGSGIQGTLNYQSAYEGRDKQTKILFENTTTVEDLGSLGALGWTVAGPSPKWTNASKEKERIAGHAIIARQA